MPVNKVKKKLAVESQSKIDRVFGKKSSHGNRPSVKVVVTKWVSTVILGLLLLGCVTDSKVSVMALSYEMNRGSSEKDTAQYFVMLQLLAIIPNVVNFIRGVWSGAFREDLPWPRKKALIVVSFCAINSSYFTSKCC